MSWPQAAWDAAYEILDSTYADLPNQTPGTRARVEGEAAAMRADFARRINLERLTAQDWRDAMAMYVLTIYGYGLRLNVSPDIPTRDSDFLGYQIAACAYLAGTAAQS